MAARYGHLALSLIYKDVGCLLQTLYFVATAQELAPCAVGGGDEAANSSLVRTGSAGRVAGRLFPRRTCGSRAMRPFGFSPRSAHARARRCPHRPTPVASCGRPDASPRAGWSSADLTLGSWRVHHAAADLAAQLGLPEPPTKHPRGTEGRPRLARRADAKPAATGRRSNPSALPASWHVPSRDELLVAYCCRATGRLRAPRHLLVRFLAQAPRAGRAPPILLAGTRDAPDVPADWDVSDRGDTRAPASRRGGWARRSGSWCPAPAGRRTWTGLP